MRIPVQCPACGTSYQVKEALAGKTAKCRKCGSPILIPAAPEDPATDPLGSPALPPADEEPWDVPAAGRTLSGLTSYTPVASTTRKDAHDRSASQGGRTLPFNPRHLLVVTGVAFCVLMIGVSVWSVVSRVRAFVAVNQSRQRIAALFDEASPPPGSPERFESPDQRYNRVAKDLRTEIANGAEVRCRHGAVPALSPRLIGNGARGSVRSAGCDGSGVLPRWCPANGELVHAGYSGLRPNRLQPGASRQQVAGRNRGRESFQL